jgi:hypothetical protein
LADAGGVKYLKESAKSNPAAFMALVGKVLPLQVTGANGGPIEQVVAVGLSEAAKAMADRIAHRSEDAGVPVSSQDGPILPVGSRLQ